LLQAPILSEIRREVVDLKKKEQKEEPKPETVEKIVQDNIKKCNDAETKESDSAGQVAEAVVPKSDIAAPEVKVEPADEEDEVQIGESLKKSELVRSPTFEFDLQKAEEEFLVIKEEPTVLLKDEEVEKSDLEVNEEEKGVEPVSVDAPAVKREFSTSSAATPSPTLSVVDDAEPKDAEDEDKVVDPVGVGSDERDWRSGGLDPEDDLRPGQYKAHVSEVEKLERGEDPQFKPAPMPIPWRPAEVTNKAATFDVYLGNLGRLILNLSFNAILEFLFPSRHNKEVRVRATGAAL
jgi:hypothetical protein